ncbi:MAG: MFS transporter [Flavobacteriales bacterium]|nr:MFS transporter [Flavobacteriales bacterium]
MYKRTMRFWEIWNINFGFLGIQFVWGLQMANMSAIYEYLGASAGDIPLLWLAAPLTGLLVQPVIGYLSDRTWHPRWGRRKPYFLIGALLASLTLIWMPNSTTLWMAAGLLWVLDASINVSMEPFRAFVSDMLPEKQHTRGYAMQSLFIGLGAVVASALPWLFALGDHSAIDPCTSGAIPSTVKMSFYIGAFVFFGAVLYTVLTTKEYPPRENESQTKRSLGDGFRQIFSGLANMPAIMKKLAVVQFFTWMGLFLMWFFFGVAITRSVFGYNDELDKLNPYYETYKKSLCANEPVADYETLIAKTKFDSNAPFTSAVEFEAKSGGFNTFLSAMQDNEKRRKQGTEWGGVCFAFYSLVTFVFSMFLPLIARRIGKRNTHMACLAIGGLGLISVLTIANPYTLLLNMTCVGIAWTSILAMPYSMFASHLPKQSVGLYMGIFNFFIVIPEIIASLTFGWVMTHVLHDNRLGAVALGGAMMLLASLLCLRIGSREQTNNPSV